LSMPRLNRGGWYSIVPRSSEYRSRLIVGADGVNSIVRRTIIGPIPKENVAACVGYFAGDTPV